MREAAYESAMYERTLHEDLEKEYRQKMEAEGNVFIDLSEEQLKDFKDAMLPVYKMVEESAGPIAKQFFKEAGVEGY